MYKFTKEIENLCKKYDISLNDLNEIKEDIFATFNDILFFEITSSSGQFYIDVSTNMPQYFSDIAREKLLNCWYKNYPSRIYDNINLFVTFFDQSNN